MPNFPPISADEWQARLTAVRERLDDWQVDGLLVSSDVNRRWLTGFTGSAGHVLITARRAMLATDFRYWEQASGEAPAYEIFRLQSGPVSKKQFIASANVASLAVEADHLSITELEQLRRIDIVDWQPRAALVEPLRSYKSASEIDRMRAAAAIADEAMAQVNALARPGMSERALAWELEKRIREAGAEKVAFDIIVAAGPNAALAHHHPGDRPLQAGDAIVVDMGAVVDGYNSDMTRSFHLGERPDERFWQIYRLVLAAQTNALEKARSGMTGQALDALARDIIDGADFGEHFGHSLGHGVGLAVHEAPSLSARNPDDVVEPGMTATIEPGVYLPGWGGVRIEDLVVFTETGIERLSHCPKEPLIPIA